VEKCAPLVAVDALLRTGSVPADVETLELYEWACREAGSLASYSETLGVLRLRWAKANPRSSAALSCFRACLREWDLVNAQQVRGCPPVRAAGDPCDRKPDANDPTDRCGSRQVIQRR